MRHDCQYESIGLPELCSLRRVTRAEAVDTRKQALEAFFDRRGRRCPACRRKVTAETSAGGRRKRYHAACAI